MRIVRYPFKASRQMIVLTPLLRAVCQFWERSIELIEIIFLRIASQDQTRKIIDYDSLCSMPTISSIIFNNKLITQWCESEQLKWCSLQKCLRCWCYLENLTFPISISIVWLPRHFQSVGMGDDDFNTFG
jgi:hypothetical protein